MFSKIPVPTVEWKEENMKYVFIFFPFVGAVIGGIVGAIVACCKNKPPKMMGINDTNINNEYENKAKAEVELFSNK